MARSSTEIIERAAETGLGVVYQRDLPDAESEFSWQRPRETRGGEFGGNGAQIEVALPRADSPQGTNHVLIRNPDEQGAVLVFTKPRFQQLVAAIKDGQYDMA